MLSIWKRLLFIIASLIIVLLVLEIGARVVYSVRLKDSAYMLFPKNAPLAMGTVVSQEVSKNYANLDTLQPGHHDFVVNGRLLHRIEINEKGFRGQDYENPKTAQFRIVTMGGSSTFSSEAPMGQSYPEVLEKLINEKHGSDFVEIVNRGMNGYSIVEIARLFADDVIPAKPDLVTICSAYNAPGGPLLIDLRKGRAPLLRRTLWMRSLFYTAIENSILARKAKQFNETDIYKDTLEKLILLANENKVNLLFVAQPLLPADRVNAEAVAERIDGGNVRELLKRFEGAAKDQERRLNVMKAMAEKNNAPFVDPRPEMLKEENPEDLFWVTLHLTANGSTQFAKIILEELDLKYDGIKALLSN